MHIFILLGVFIHLLFLISIFDVYFKSSISNIDIVYESRISPPAKRLVVFISDGLSAHSVYNFINDFTIDHAKPYRNHTPFMNSIIREHGSWGISIAGVPTESRPGHVAILSGIHEDPSAIFSGWGEFPFEFDSLVNESRQTFGWGDAHILNTFAKVKNKYTTYNIPIKNDYGNKEHYKLDSWIFNDITSFFKHTKNYTDPILLWEDKIIYLLCLPSADDAGHSQKPDSKKFEQTVINLDGGLRNITKLLNEYYKDNKTSFLLTSDHGMTSWGSHGSGSHRETQTPLLLWGAGIAKNNNQSIEVNQTDLPVLLATLLGVPIPKHSLGILPGHVLDIEKDDIFEAYHNNIQQLLEYYRTKENEKTNYIGFRPFQPLTNLSLSQKLNFIEELRRNNSYHKAIENEKQIITEILIGINYCQNYYQSFFQVMVTISMIAWMLITIGFVLMHQSKNVKKITKITKTTYFIISPFLIVFLICATLTMFSGMDYSFLIYTLIPLTLLSVVVLQHKIWSQKIRELAQYSPTTKLEIFLYLVICFTFLELLVLSFFIRHVLSIIILAIGLWMDVKSRQSSIPNRFRAQWIINIILLAGFPLLPGIAKQGKMLYLFYIGNVCWIFFGFLTSFQDLILKKKWYQEMFIFKIQFVLVVTVILLSVIGRSLDLEQKFTSVTKFLAWILLATNMVLPLLSNLLIPVRVMGLIFCFSISYIMLSVAYEPLFFLILSLTTITWLNIEYNIYQKSMDPENYVCQDLFSFKFLCGRTTEKTMLSTTTSITERIVDKEDLRRAIFCICFFILSLFGTGNTSDINSFDPNWTKLLITEYAFVIMSSLVIWKIIIPILFVSIVYYAINHLLQAPVLQLLLIITTCSDIMAINFFYLIHNRGSWLEIGLSVSHYIIIESMILSIVLLLFISKLFLKFSLRNFIGQIKSVCNYK